MQVCGLALTNPWWNTTSSSHACAKSMGMVPQVWWRSFPTWIQSCRTHELRQVGHHLSPSRLSWDRLQSYSFPWHDPTKPPSALCLVHIPADEDDYPGSWSQTTFHDLVFGYNNKPVEFHPILAHSRSGNTSSYLPSLFVLRHQESVAISFCVVGKFWIGHEDIHWFSNWYAMFINYYSWISM